MWLNWIVYCFELDYYEPWSVEHKERAATCIQEKAPFKPEWAGAVFSRGGGQATHQFGLSLQKSPSSSDCLLRLGNKILTQWYSHFLSRPLSYSIQSKVWLICYFYFLISERFWERLCILDYFRKKLVLICFNARMKTNASVAVCCILCLLLCCCRPLWSVAWESLWFLAVKFAQTNIFLC